jgi:O-antigen ligase
VFGPVLGEAGLPQKQIPLTNSLPAPDPPDPVARFKSLPARPGLATSERRTLAAVIACLVFLPWAIGGMHLWSQVTGAVLALVALLAALMPEPGATEPPWRRLVRFPGFWAGLAALSYVCIQALNPAWVYRANESLWWLEPIDYVTWLPAGMETPFENSSQWRALIVVGMVSLLVCAAWIGLRRRRALQVLAIALVANACLLAIVGLAQQLSGAEHILWLVPSSNESFFGTFIYRNHAGPWLNLGVALACGLAWSFAARSARRLDKSGPAPLLAFVAVVIGLGVVFSLSRGSIVVLAVFALAMLAALGLRLIARRDDRRAGAVVAIVALVLALFVAGGLQRLGIERVIDRFSMLIDGADTSAQLRAVASQASSEMLADRWPLGWGAGTFRFGFPIYQMRRPEIYFPGETNFSNRLHWEHAHNDWLQWPIEYGAVGMLLLAITPLFLLVRFARAGGLTNPFAMPVALGCLLVLGHGAADFVFQNPAVLATWAVMLVMATRWAELDEA